MRRLVILAVLLLAGCTSSGGDSATAPATRAAPTSSSPAASPSTPASSTQPSGTAPADWPTYHGTPDRAGVSSDLPRVDGAPKVVVRLRLDEAMYASPVVVGGTVIAVTEGNSVYAFDLSGRQRWHRTLGAPSPASERPCGNIDPLGITGTPVVANGTVYVSPELGGPPRHRLVALDLRTGAVKWQRDIDLPGVETKAMQERGALAIAGGRVWVPFGGLAGDCGGYKGRVVGVRLDGQGAPIAYTVPTTREAGIWTPPGPAVGSAGNLYVAVGNGESGVGDPYDYSDSVLKIGPDAKLRDSFSPTTWPTDNDADLDLGSQGPALVGPWVFSAGKSGTAYVLRRDHLGGIGGEVSQLGLCRSFGGTAVVRNVVYVPCTDGVRAVRIDSAGKMHMLWHAADSIAGSPVVGGGRVWALDQGAGVLHALDPATGKTREQVDVGETSRFATPALYGRYVLVPTLAGLTAVSVGA
ncbi:MAG TPA: PQQ-binding-like beta-propeller repeat protein [Jatrophihabitantaceae bacterium]